MLESKPFSQLVVARLGEFFAEKTAWFRGLWDVGTILSLRELLEIAPLSPAVISQEALDWMAEDVASVVTKDEGLLRRTQLEIRKLLEGDIQPGTLAALATLVREVDGQYLKLWARALAHTGTPKVSVERSARAIATHLLGAGFSQAFLHRWLTYQVEHSPKIHTLEELVLEADALAQAPQRSFSVFVPMNGALDPHEAPPEWLDASKARTWLLQNHFAPVKQGGAWLLEIEARDMFAAVQRASEWADRIAARLRIGAQKTMRDIGRAYVKGEGVPTPLRRQRVVEVRSIERQSQLFKGDGEGGHRIDAAFELLAQLDGPPIVAVGTGWAAIEALLSAPGDKNKVMAADRAAALVACSFPRAELTLLASKQIRMGSSPLKPDFDKCASNRERAQVMADALVKASTPLTWSDPQQQAAVDRLKVLLGNPGPGLKDVLAYANRVFRRLYRQRNLVLHGRVTRSVVLTSALRTAAPLLGAAMDRLAHAWFVYRVEPLELSARAKVRLDLVGTKGATGLVELLE